MHWPVLQGEKGLDSPSRTLRIADRSRRVLCESSNPVHLQSQPENSQHTVCFSKSRSGQRPLGGLVIQHLAEMRTVAS